MAIGTTPLFSKISGSVGPVDYRTRRNGKIEIGKKRIPANPQSTRQLDVRNAYGRLHELWQNASYIDKTQYERLGKLYDVSPWNAFLMRHQSEMSAAPVASWGMVENTGGTLHDLTANENHGTIYGAVWKELGEAKLSYLDFDIVDDHVDCGNSPNLKITDEISLSAWVKIKEPSQNYPRLIDKLKKVGALWYGYNVLFMKINNKISFELGFNDGTHTNCQTSSTLNYDQWYYVVCTYDKQNLKIYINGYINCTPAPSTKSIGTFDYSFKITDLPFGGAFSTLNVYTTALSDQQIINYYNNTKHLYGVYP